MNLEAGEELACSDMPFGKVGRQSARGGEQPGTFERPVLANHKKQNGSSGQQIQTSPSLVFPPGLLTLGDVASVLRSKNAGPFEITFDIMFDTEEVYSAVKHSEVLNQTVVEKLFHLSPEEIIWCGWFKQALAFKAFVSPSWPIIPSLRRRRYYSVLNNTC